QAARERMFGPSVHERLKADIEQRRVELTGRAIVDFTECETIAAVNLRNPTESRAKRDTARLECVEMSLAVEHRPIGRVLDEDRCDALRPANNAAARVQNE